jgi:transcriptional regulator with GAF, ATPase, and Fis domain
MTEIVGRIGGPFPSEMKTPREARFPGRSNMQAPTPKEALNVIIGNSAPLSRVFDLVRIVAPKDVRVLIPGERGTGKELAADAIHALSGRGKMPFIKINCAVLSRDLLASELFGHVRGSFTGAISTRT